jgi:hypothetical protein
MSVDGGVFGEQATRILVVDDKAETLEFVSAALSAGLLPLLRRVRESSPTPSPFADLLSISWGNFCGRRLQTAILVSFGFFSEERHRRNRGERRDLNPLLFWGGA